MRRKNYSADRVADAFLTALFAAFLLSGCAGIPDAPTVPPETAVKDEESAYRIGPTDALQIFVWRQQELSSNVIVRPDGKISVPLIEDLQAAGRTPTELSKAIAEILAEYIQDPRVTVLVTNFVGLFDRQIRVVGEAARPQAIPFRRNMTVLDVMIQVGGLTEFAAGNRAVIIRAGAEGKRESYRIRLNDLLKDGDVTANAYVLPGDVIIVPQTYF